MMAAIGAECFQVFLGTHLPRESCQSEGHWACWGETTELGRWLISLRANATLTTLFLGTGFCRFRASTSIHCREGGLAKEGWLQRLPIIFYKEAELNMLFWVYAGASLWLTTAGYSTDEHYEWPALLKECADHFIPLYVLSTEASACHDGKEFRLHDCLEQTVVVAWYIVRYSSMECCVTKYWVRNWLAILHQFASISAPFS